MNNSVVVVDDDYDYDDLSSSSLLPFTTIIIMTLYLCSWATTTTGAWGTAWASRTRTPSPSWPWPCPASPSLTTGTKSGWSAISEYLTRSRSIPRVGKVLLLLLMLFIDLESGCSCGPDEYLNEYCSRDPERTPMQWNAQDQNAGFTDPSVILTN